MRDSAGRREVIEVLRRSLSYDHLAGLAKCRAFFDAAESTDECWSRTRSPASLMVNDANHCKVMHDTYGYHVGDAVLRHLTSPHLTSPHFYSASSRTRDFVARFGGEKYLVLLPSTDLAAAEVVERV